MWQDWATNTAGSWRQPGASGGGFLFDTGAHMLNTVTDLAGEDFTEVAAWQEDDGYPVDIRSVVMGRLASGALVTMNACGRAILVQLRRVVLHDRRHPANGDVWRAARAAASRPGGFGRSLSSR